VYISPRRNVAVTQADAAAAVRVAIIVPAYQQPGLLVEALDTALAQETDFGYAIVVVNDGCPSEETDRVCLEFASANPRKIYYLHKRNGGLSAARNTGIEFALAAFPALESVYFLDSDNRIGRHLLQRLYHGLRQGGPEVGWAYPDVDKFGFPEFCDTSGAYSPLEHLFRNFCEAGSMASRRMLDAGLRFDEEMRQGTEDWEFWLQGLERGFRGVHVPDAGFGYRRRGESMLVASERNYRPIVEHIRARHPRLFDVRAMLRLEAEASRRYAVYLPDVGTVRCFTHADEDGEHLSVDEFARRLLRAPERPGYGSCPGHVVVMDSALFEYFRTHRLLNVVLWTVERALLQAMVVACRVSFESEGGEWAVTCRGRAVADDILSREAGPDGDAEIVAVYATSLLGLVRKQTSTPRGMELDLALRIPVPAPSLGRQAVNELNGLRERLAGAWARDEYGGWSAAQIDRYRSSVALPADFYGRVHDLPSVLALGPKGAAGQMALVIDPERADVVLPAVAPFVARLRRRGWSIHLVGMGAAALSWSDHAQDLFASVIPFSTPLATSERAIIRGDAYLGTLIPRLEDSDLAMAVGTLAPFDVVISVENALVHALMGRLRKLRVETWALLGIADPTTPPVETINACAAFEHAYRRVIVLDEDTRRLCRALGFPPEKVRHWVAEDAGNDDDWVPRSPVSAAPVATPDWRVAA
jgi:glycosyltransferase involved in cell wall biosynthesis